MYCASAGCRWCGYAYDYLLDRFSGDAAAARAGLKASGCRVGNGKFSLKACEDSARHVDALRRFRALEHEMSARNLSRAPGVDWAPHRHPAWWAASPFEWAEAVGAPMPDGTDPSSSECWTLFPGYDSSFRVIGAWAMRPGSVTGPPAAVAAGTYGGLLFRHGIRVGEPNFMMLSKVSAAACQLTSAADSEALAPVVAPIRFGSGYVDQIAADARGPLWILVDGVRDSITDSSAWMRLAAALDARMVSDDGAGVLPPAAGRRFGAYFVAKAERWHDRLKQTVLYGPAHAGRALLSSVGWPGRAEEAARENWERSAYQKAAALAAWPTEASVEVRKGLWVLDTDRGWVDGSTGAVLAAAAPSVHEIFREGRKKVHSGVVRYAGRLYPFRSARFRRDPVGVVETALLRGGVTSPEPPHPAVARHMADLACFFGRQNHRNS